MEEFFTRFWNAFVDFTVAYGFRILGTLLILLIGPALIRAVVKVIGKTGRFSRIDRSTQTLIVDIVKVLLYVLLVALIAANIGIEATAIAAVIASCGLVIGLALQGSLSNFAGGLMILIFKPFRIGDCIETGSHTGIVTDIGILYSSLTTFDNKVVTIPNGTLANSTVVDYSAKELRRVDLKLRIAPNADTELAKETLRELAEAHASVIHGDTEHPVFVRVGEYTEDAAILCFRVWVKSQDYWNVFFDLTEESRKSLDRRGFALPYPKTEVYVRHTEK